MKKILINKCYGGFSISGEVEKLYLERKKLNYICKDGNLKVIPKEKYTGHWNQHLYVIDDNGKEIYFYSRNISRDDEDLIFVVEKIGLQKSGGECAKLKIVEIPENIDWYIHEYDGMESVEESHSSWS